MNRHLHHEARLQFASGSVLLAAAVVLAQRFRSRTGSIRWRLVVPYGIVVGVLSALLTAWLSNTVQQLLQPGIVPLLAAFSSAAICVVWVRYAGAGVARGAVGPALLLAVAVALFAGTSWAGMRLDRHISSPEAYGARWDYQVGFLWADDMSPRLIDNLRSGLGRFGSFATGTLAEVVVSRESSTKGAVIAPFYGLDPGSGVIEPRVLAGQSPSGEDEILLAAVTARDLGVRVGDAVRLATGTRHGKVRVAGIGLLPHLGDNGVAGHGGFMSFRALRRLYPQAPRNMVILDFQPGLERLGGEQVAAQTGMDLVSAATVPPIELVNMVRDARADSTARVAASAVAALAFGLLVVGKRSADATRRSIAAGLAALAVGAAAGLAVGELVWTIARWRYGLYVDLPWVKYLVLGGAVAAVAAWLMWFLLRHPVDAGCVGDR